jgi:hypothetical protein
MIIGLVGYIGSGKDTVADILLQHGGVRDSFAKPLKDVCSSVFGWPRELLEGDTLQSREFRETPDMFWSRKLGIAHFTPRLALQLMGTEVMRNQFHENIWLNSLEYRIMSSADDPRCVIISDARFQNELNLIRKMNGKVIWVQRGELPEWYDTAVSANKGNAVSNKIMRTKYVDVHESEWNWAGYDVDFTIDNNGSLEELQIQVNKLSDSLHGNRLKAI